MFLLIPICYYLANQKLYNNTLTRKNKNMLNHTTKPPNLISIITHKDGNDKTITDVKEPHNKMTTNVKALQSTSNDNKQLKQDNYDMANNKSEYDCHLVARNPKFLTSISYPNIAQQSPNMTKARVNVIKKESRARQHRSKDNDGVKMHPRKVLCNTMP